MASAPCPGLKRTNEYPPKTSSLSEGFWANIEKLAASTKRIATADLRINLFPPKCRTEVCPVTELIFPGGRCANDKPDGTGRKESYGWVILPATSVMQGSELIQIQ